MSAVRDIRSLFADYASYHRTSGDEIHDGILGCQCCVFPVVDGIPVMHLQPAATAAREFVEQGRPDRARQAMFGLDDEREAEQFDALIASDTTTYRNIVDALASTSVIGCDTSPRGANGQNDRRVAAGTRGPDRLVRTCRVEPTLAYGIAVLRAPRQCDRTSQTVRAHASTQ